MFRDWQLLPVLHAAIGGDLLDSYPSIGSLPIIPAGLLLESMVESNFRAICVIAFTTISFGLLLLLADVKGQRVRTESELTWRQALLIGGAQCFALIPGTSRSGVTMTAALFCGFDR